MARLVSPATLENMALDAIMKNISNVVNKLVIAEEGAPKLVVDRILEMIKEKLQDLESRLRVLSRRLRKLKKALCDELGITKCLIEFYAEIQERMHDLTESVYDEMSVLREKWKRQGRNEHNYIPETCQKIHDVLKSAVDFIQDQECKSVKLYHEQLNNSDEHSGYFYRGLCMDIHKILETGAESISDLQSKFFMHLQHPPHEVYRQLHYIINNRIPPSLGDKMAQKLIDYIQRLYYRKYKYDTYYEENMGGRTALNNLIRAVIHPSVRTVDLGSCDMICYSFCIEMSSFSNIVVLKLGALKYYEHHYYDGSSLKRGKRHIDQFIISGVEAMKNLQIFHYYNCTDGVLEALAENCRNLRCLNIKESRRLNEKSIASFADLGYLEEINLMRTRVSRSLVHVINRMDQNEVTVSENETTKSSLLLKSLSCSITSSSQVSVIVSKLCNIRKLKILIPQTHSERFRGERSFSCIKDLQFLVSISFENCKFSDIEEIVVRKGKGMLELKLKKVTDVDVTVISANCPALVHLSLKFGTFNSNPSLLGNIFLPALEHLCLERQNDEPLSVIMMCGCPKLTAVKIKCYECTDLDKVLQRNSLQYLEDLTIHTSSLPLEYLRQVIYQCGKLIKLTYKFPNYEYWEGDYVFMMRDLIREVKPKFLGLRLNL